jgi:hypothetical protein
LGWDIEVTKNQEENVRSYWMNISKKRVLSFEGGSCGSQYVEGSFWEEEIVVTRRQGRRRKNPLDDLNDRRGYCHFEGDAVVRNVSWDRFGKNR